MEQRDRQLLKDFYRDLPKKIAAIKTLFNRPLTLTEKILFSHIEMLPSAIPVRGEETLNFKPDRVAMQDATAQMAMLQFMTTGLKAAKVPATIHCDHLIRAHVGSEKDLLKAFDENQEVYEFLRTAAEKYQVGFWQPGSGIIHQVVLEKYAFPGGMMVGTDSHTPNAGGLGMLAIGVGGADAVDVMAGIPWGLLNPQIIGVKLTGRLSSWTSPKDIILKVAGLLTVKGGTGRIIEYFGEGTSTISCTGKATITNMGAELGATTSVFPYDQKMSDYLRMTERTDVADWADLCAPHLVADPEVISDPKRYYDQLIEIDLNTLEPAWVGPHTPDLYRTVSEMKDAVQKESYPDQIKFALIGSCTNSSYEDISRSASIARQAIAAGLKVKVPFMVTPGSDQVFQTIKRDGLMDTLLAAGATVLANACGPCIGQWQRDDIKKGEKNTIITSYNRNFKQRNDGNEETMAFIGSPELVTAMAFSGQLSFNPLVDSILKPDGSHFRFEVPSGQDLPSKGFAISHAGYQAPIVDSKVQVKIDPKSDRLAFLEPFPAWPGTDFQNLVLLLKAKGKCTTDHISQAGPWLKYRGHLANIAKNTYLGAVNAFTAEAGKGTNQLTGQTNVSFPDIAFQYREAKQSWIVVADENYGEGSSREHAAMQPRFLGCVAVVAKSFARIAETNLKKQGVLALTFKNPLDYDLIPEDSRFDLTNLKSLSVDSKVFLLVKPKSGQDFQIELVHSYTPEQIRWFRAGAALNAVE